MKKRNNKALLSSLTLLSLSIIPVSGISVIHSINTTNIKASSSNLQDASSSTRDVGINTITMQLYKDYQKLDWYGKGFASSVTEAQLKELIVPNLKFDVNYGINILTPAGEALSNGYVQFTVYQIKNNFSSGVTTKPDGSSSSTTPDTTPDGRVDIAPTSDIQYSNNTNSKIDMRAYDSDTGNITINGKTVKKNLVWTTKNIGGLFLEHKYSFSWNDNEKIGDFLRETDKSTLTPDDVYTNMISRSKITDILPSDTVTANGVITFSQDKSSLETYGISDSDAKKYGIGVVSVDFSKSASKNTTDWVGNKIPKETYLVRGLTTNNSSSSSDKEEMHLNLDDDTSSFLNTKLSVSAIRAQNPSFKLPSGASSDTATTITISDFTPTELINALLTSSDGSSNLLSLLTTKQYLNITANDQALPALYLTYMGRTVYDTAGPDASKANQWNGTGLDKAGKVPTVKDGVIDYNNTMDPSHDSKITNILASADNESGSLYLNITYNKYNVFQNTMEIGDKTSIVISGLQTDDNQALNNKNLYFQWKSIDQLSFSNSQDIMDLYTKNKNNESYLKSLSNLFFQGSANVYGLDRTVNMKVEGNNLVITLDFGTYGNINGGWTFSNSYPISSLSGPSAQSSGITFKDQDKVANTIKQALKVSDLSQVTPSQVINAIGTNDTKGLLSLDNFYDANKTGYSYSTIVVQSDTNDGIVVEVTATTGTTSYQYSYIYNGMATGTPNSYIYNFTFNSTDSELQKGIANLKSIPIDLITKQDVYDNYVSKLPIYNGDNKLPLSIDDFEIKKDLENNSITISITVPIATTGSTDGSKIYTNTVKGFTTATIKNNNSNSVVKNLTLPLSLGFSLAIIIIMTGLVTHLIIKRKKLAKSKINLKEARKSGRK